jgi:hypothetical protein
VLESFEEGMFKSDSKFWSSEMASADDVDSVVAAISACRQGTIGSTCRRGGKMNPKVSEFCFVFLIYRLAKSGLCERAAGKSW